MNKKNYSIGISLETSIRSYKKLFKKYNSRIEEVYFSPNLGLKFQSRSNIQDSFLKQGNKKIKRILKLAKKYNINIELALNSTKKLDINSLKEAYLWCIKNKINIDSIVTFNELIHSAKSLFGNSVKYICSYNENLRSYDDLYNISQEFDEVVIGNSFIRDTTALCILKERGFKIRLLLNNGCSHNCLWCSGGGNRYCDSIFNKNLEKESIEMLIAKQSVYPFEIKEFYEKTQLIDSYKISSRSIPDKHFYNVVTVYFREFNHNNLEDILSTMLLAVISNYTIKNFKNIDKEKIIELKKELINEELKKLSV